MQTAVDIIEKTENWIGPVSLGTLVAALGIIVFLGWIAHSKIVPMINSQAEKRAQKKIEKQRQQEHLTQLENWQKTHIEFSEHLSDTIKGMNGNIQDVQRLLAFLVESNHTTMSVLLDIVECMQTGTNSDECAIRAQNKINKFFINNGLKNLS